MNVLTITGHLGRDAEVRYTANQKAVCSFSVPMKSGYGDREQTDWVSCSFWGQRGESLAPHLLKGTLVAVSGEHQEVPGRRPGPFQPGPQRERCQPPEQEAGAGTAAAGLPRYASPG